MSDHNYKPTFFIVPSYILDLPGLTLGYLKVYETIFQFWNKNLLCFLSEASLCERTNLKRSQVYEALSFFEKHNELKRIRIKGKKCFMRPTQYVETDCTETIPMSGVAEKNVRCSGQNTSGAADHNIKNRSKEINTTSEKSSDELSDAIALLKKYEIKPPKKLKEGFKDYINRALKILNDAGFTLEDYLNYLTKKCNRALLPYSYNGVERQNGFGNILRPSFINDVLIGKWED